MKKGLDQFWLNKLDEHYGKQLIVQFGSFTAVTDDTCNYLYNDYDFISFKGEAWQGKKEIYTTLNGEYYIDFYLYDEEYTVTHEINLGHFASDDWINLTHDIIMLADDQKNINVNDIKNLVKKYKNEISNK